MNILRNTLTITLIAQFLNCGSMVHAFSQENVQKSFEWQEDAVTPKQNKDTDLTSLTQPPEAGALQTKTANINGLTQSIAILALQTTEQAKKTISETPNSELRTLLQTLGVQGIAVLAWQSGAIKNILETLPYGSVISPMVESYCLSQSNLDVAATTILTHNAVELSSVFNHPIFNYIAYALIYAIITGNTSTDMLFDAILSGAKIGVGSYAASTSMSYLWKKISPFFKSIPEQSHSPLHLAALHGDLETVKSLLSEKDTDANVQDELGNTPLHYALLNKYQEVAEIIIDALTSKTGGFLGFFQKAPTVRWPKNNDGETPLYLASKNGYLDIVKKLCDYGALQEDNRAPDKQTPFLAAVKGNHLKVVEFYLDHHTFNSAVDQDDMSALEKININNHVDSNQNTALHIAALFGQANMVKLLLKKGADINRKNRVGFTPLHFAAIHGSENTIKALANNPDCDLLIQGGADAQTALHQAVMYNKTGSIKALLNRAKINQQLEEMLNSTDAKGQTARDLATQKNNQEAIELLQP